MPCAKYLSTIVTPLLPPLHSGMLNRNFLSEVTFIPKKHSKKVVPSVPGTFHVWPLGIVL